MALILHLSDVHLGRAPQDEIADAYKQEFVPIAQRVSRQRILLWTLESLQEVVKARPLDAVVVSGDLTVANHEDGFAKFEELIAALGPLRPPNHKVVVVPGNHDVTWQTQAASAERYELFDRYIRAAGYVTPLLDGTDIDSDGRFIGDPKLPHYILSDDDGWIIVPINSSDYSGSLEPLPNLPDDVWDGALAEIEMRAGPAAAADVRRLRQYDAARVSPAQLEALRALLDCADAEAATPPPLRIGVIHHHLLPVSVREEVKSFESITNLGLLRNFLRENNVRLVLHGHKHREFLYKDHVYATGGFGAGEAHEILVAAGATIGTDDWDEAHICRLIEIEGARRAPRIALASVAGKDPGARADEPVFVSVPLWRHSESPVASDAPQFVYGADVDETYERLMTLFEVESELTHVVCRVEDPTTADRLPVSYPEIPDVLPEAREEWYEQLVRWWQKTDSKLRERLYFTHGGRIVRPGIDQIQAAAEALRREPQTARAIVTLLDPTLDEVGRVEHRYPAFCLVQFLRRERGGAPQLDCIGYFRKQQMRYWWPVNLGELRHVQKLVIDELGGSNAPFNAGPLWTVTALAVLGTTVPRVAVPTIDRIFDEDEDQLWKLAYAVSWKGVPEREAAVAQLLDMVEELIPAEDFDPDGVPVALEGLAHVAAALTRFGEYHPESPATALGKCLQELYCVNSSYDSETRTRVTTAVHTKWRKRASELVVEARGILEPLTNRT
jgi:3',5'-cyclic AMP phosphodiesterase CpdA